MVQLIGHKIATGAFVLGIAIIGLVIFLAYASNVSHPSLQVLEQENLNKIGRAMHLYANKYGRFPAFDGLSEPGSGKATLVHQNGGKPACLALKLLVKSGLVNDPKIFFSTRDSSPSENTLDSMLRDSDPLKDSSWACTFAYDPGHNPSHGATAYLGNNLTMLLFRDNDVAQVLSCDQVLRIIEPNSQGAYVIPVNSPEPPISEFDNIYQDNSEHFGIRDSFLQWDCPAELSIK